MLRISETIEALRKDAAGECIRILSAAIERAGRCSIALAGGSTPRAIYALLADPAAGFRERLAWDRVHFFWGDERHVPPDHSDSNYRMAHEALLSQIPVPTGNLHRIRGEEPDAGQAAAAYEEELRTFFRLRQGEQPRFDLILLGMGADGHTASIFPGTPAVGETKRLVMAVEVAKLGTERITLTPGAINQAANVVFIVAGADKAETLKAVLEGDEPIERYPSRAIRPGSGEILWLVNRDAAARLSG